MKITATFVTSAASLGGMPQDGLAEIALVGRSNVGKSSLINALVRQKIARTSSSPGKTRLANIYRVERASSAPFYLVDLPGFGYARAQSGSHGASERRAAAAEDFRALTEAYFGRGQVRQVGQVGRVRRVGKNTTFFGDSPDPPDLPDSLDLPDRPALSAVLLVDSRHPGLENDLDAWAWLKEQAAKGAVAATKVVATKVDKLARGERIRAMRDLESVLEHSVLPVSAATGEGLDELWILIDELANNNRLQPRTPRATAPPPPTRQAALRASPPAATTAHRREATRGRPRKKLPRK